MQLQRPCLALLLLGGMVESALADELQLTVGVSEAETGKVLRAAACALVRDGAKQAYARFVSPEYRGRVAVQDGDTLLVYRRGCDLARVNLKGGQRSVEVALQPASRQCAIDLAETNKEDVRFRLMWWIKSAGSWVGREPIVDSYQEVVQLPYRKRIPRGAAVFVIAEVEGKGAAGRLFWPRTSYLEGDSPRVALRAESAWRPTLRIDAPDDGDFGPPAIEILPDYSFVPPGPPERVDTWIWQVTTAGWARKAGVRDGGQLEILPPVPLLALTSVSGRTVARRFKPGDSVIDLRQTIANRVLGAVPWIDRKPAPPGSFVVSGRHDIATVGSILASRTTFPGLVIELSDKQRGKLPAEAELLAADWLTVWHPRFGLAHVRWHQAGVPAGQWYPGSMTIRAPKGWLLSGSVVAFPIWRGTGRINATPPVEELQRKVDGVALIRYDGLPRGWYSFQMKFDLIQPGTDVRHTVQVNNKVEITAENLRRSYRFFSPDRLPPK